MEKLSSDYPYDMGDFSNKDIFNPDIFNNKDEVYWDKLIQQIVDGNVIPVIGADLLVDNPTNPHQFVIDGLSKALRINEHVNSFSELIYTDQYRKAVNDNLDSIYYQVDTVFSRKTFQPSEKLRRLLSIKQFPFVITTSFTPVVEQQMKLIWKDELRIMKFNNNPSENNDIKNAADLRKPTLYYMFGKVGNGAHKYVLSEIDLLDFVSSWLSNDKRPKNLCNELRDKYLLILGNTYSDWLFRFIWYSMRKTDLSHGMFAYDTLDQSLINFLERSSAFTKQNTSDVIDQILVRLEAKLKKNESTKFNKPQENMDVFISYSRTDSSIAEKLYESLTAQGIRVWYDKYNLTEGGLFMDEIQKAINTAKYFIPILSSNIEREKNDPHVYRNEWDMAIQVAISMGRTYIIPLSEEGFDFYKASIPGRMQQHNAISYSGIDSIESIAEKIIHKMNQE